MSQEPKILLHPPKDIKRAYFTNSRLKNLNLSNENNMHKQNSSLSLLKFNSQSPANKPLNINESFKNNDNTNSLLQESSQQLLLKNIQSVKRIRKLKIELKDNKLPTLNNSMMCQSTGNSPIRQLLKPQNSFNFNSSKENIITKQQQQEQYKPFSYNFNKYLENRKSMEASLTMNLNNSLNMAKSSTRLESIKELSFYNPLSQDNKTSKQGYLSTNNSDFKFSNCINVATIEKNFFKNQGQKQELMLKIEDQQQEIEYLKEINKNLVNQLLQSKLDTQQALKKVQQDADDVFGNFETPIRRRTSLKKQQKRNSPIRDYNLIELASQQQSEMQQEIANQIEELQEMLSQLMVESGQKINKLESKCKKYKSKYYEIIKIKSQILKQYQSEAIKSSKLNEQIQQMKDDARKKQYEFDSYISLTNEQTERISDLKINLDRYRNQIIEYQRRYQEIDLDALHEQIQYLQTKNITQQQKINQLTNQLQDQEKGSFSRQTNLYEKILGKSIGLNNDDDDENESQNDNAQVFIQGHEDIDPEKMTPMQREQFENGKLLLQKALAKKGINLNYEIKLNNKEAKKFEWQII